MVILSEDCEFFKQNLKFPRIFRENLAKNLEQLEDAFVGILASKFIKEFYEKSMETRNFLKVVFIITEEFLFLGLAHHVFGLHVLIGSIKADR